MNDDAPSNERLGPAEPDADRACEVCGRYGAVEIADRHLCVDCYDGCGSCCQGSTLE